MATAFDNGFPFADIPDGGSIEGTIAGDAALLVRRGEAVYAVGAHCTHYRGPLGRGLVVGETIRCPLHHACFSLTTGEALRAPAFDPIDCWDVERVGDRVFVRGKRTPPAPADVPSAPDSIVIVGGGAAGYAAADMLRCQRYEGPVTILSADSDGPVDRPNLSKEYLAGKAEESWIPMRDDDWYRDRRIDLRLNARAVSIDTAAKQVRLEDGGTVPYGALLVATGADPVRLTVPGAGPAQVQYLRTLADSRAIIARASTAKRALVIGASFIGLEVAASLRTRGLDVHVVAPEAQPLERVLGTDVGRAIRALHESKGVTFHFGATVAKLDGQTATLSTGDTVNDVDLVVAGVGVRPALSLAEQSGLAIDRGIVVNEYLETSVPGVYAAGDIARWPDAHSGDSIRVEHWVVAGRQGQVAAMNMLGRRITFDAVPFFWSRHFDKSVHYVGHAEKWDAVEIDGSLDQYKATITYKRDGRALAVATIGRARAALEVEAAMEG